MNRILFILVAITLIAPIDMAVAQKREIVLSPRKAIAPPLKAALAPNHTGKPLQSAQQPAPPVNEEPAQRTYDLAHKQAIDTGKPLVVLTGASWCPGCMTVKKNIEAVKGVEFIYVYVDKDTNPKLAAKFTKAANSNTIPVLMVSKHIKDGEWSLSYHRTILSTAGITALIGSPQK